MKEAQVILNWLLDKFENSKHLSEPNVSRRRVMLRIDKRELPEYQYEDAVVRDAYNAAARELEQQALVRLEWAESRAFSPASCWIWNGSHSAMNAPTRSASAKKGGRGRTSYYAKVGGQSCFMDCSMAGCCMHSGTEQHESPPPNALQFWHPLRLLSRIPASNCVRA